MTISSSPTLRSRSRKGIHTWIHGQNDGSRLPSRQTGVSFTDSLPIVQSGNCRKTTSENNGSPSFMAFFKSLATAGYLFQGGVRPYRVHISLTCSINGLWDSTIYPVLGAHRSCQGQWHIYLWSCLLFRIRLDLTSGKTKSHFIFAHLKLHPTPGVAQSVLCSN